MRNGASVDHRSPRHRTLYAFNLDRQLELVTRPDGQTVDFVYGASTGRLDSVVAPNGIYGYGYDPTSGNLASISEPGGGSLAFGYDGSLPTSVTWSGAVAGSVEVGYNDSFEPISRTVNGTLSTTYGFDDDGLLTQAGALDLDYDPTTGFLETTAVGSSTDERTYTSFGELDTYTAKHSGLPVYSFDTTRDLGGRIVSKSESIGGTTTLWEYHYDLAGRLDEVKKDGLVVETYGYDANSNRTSFLDFWGSGTATYDDQDRLLAYGGATFTYTANGELLTKVEGPETTTYGYDVFGNLRTVTLPTGVEIEYLIDPQNRRIGKKVNGSLVQGFLWQSQLRPAAELDGSGNVVAEFVYATKVNVPDSMVKGSTTYRLVTDHLGSIRLVIDTATGAIAQRIDYDPWGRILQDTNPGFQPFGFAGGLYDTQTGLVRFGARDYDSSLGRWTCKDPIGFAGQDFNQYGYVLSDPMNFSDPFGLRALTSCESRILSKYFPEEDLSRIEIKDGIPWLARKLGAEEAQAWTFRNTIYMAPGIDAADTISGIALIGHELVHSAQYDEYGVIGLGQRYRAAYKANLKAGMSEYDAYRNNPFEIPAFDMGQRIRDDLDLQEGDLCGCEN